MRNLQEKAECAALFRPTHSRRSRDGGARALLPGTRCLRYVIARSHRKVRGPRGGPAAGEDFLSATRIAALLQAPPRIVNIGLPAFADELKAAGIPVVQLDWAPPAIADPRIRALLAKLS
jgi:hypothetical protein